MTAQVGPKPELCAAWQSVPARLGCSDEFGDRSQPGRLPTFASSPCTSVEVQGEHGGAGHREEGHLLARRRGFLRRFRDLVTLGLAIAFVPLTAGEGIAQAIDENLWVTNGQVNGVVREGGTVYIGGSFSQVGPATGGGVPIDVASGGLPSSFPRITGIVYAAVPDGAGGWYVGGWFTAVGGIPRSNVAHVASDMSVSTWNPNADALINCLAVSGTTVYAGGIFTTIGGQARNYIAALDAATGEATAWNPSADGEVRSLAVSSSTVYACGAFTSIGDSTRNYIAALDATSGAATAWNPNANSYLYVIAVRNSTIYAGGNFTIIGDSTRNHIAALDATTGAATAWNPNANSNVWGIAVSDNIVYACGPFTSIGDSTRNTIAALDTGTGAATAWNPSTDGEVYTLAVSGLTVYAGGYFTSIGGQARNFIAALDATTGMATAWDPNANNGVWVLAVSGSTIYAGGEFTSLGGQTRNNIAALDATTGAATAWNPNADGPVLALGVSGSTVYAVGGFTSIGGQARNRIASLDATTGLATAWSPNADQSVRALAVSGSTVYAGGDFTSIGGQARNYIAALDATTGMATAWNPNANGYVSALAVSGSTVYAGGDFTSIGGQARNRIAALNATTGLATAWNPNANSFVLALAVNGSTVYAGGAFSSIGAQARSYVAALDTITGVASAWSPSANAGVRALAVSGSTVYAGGDFTSIGAQARNYVAALDATAGAATAWNPDAASLVLALTVSGSTIYAGGSFTSIGGLPQSGIAAIAAMPDVQAVQPASGGNTGVVTVTVAGHNLLNGATVRLSRSGQPDIPGSGVLVADDGLSLTATFDLAGQAQGLWDVVVVNPDLQTASLPNGFTIDSGAAAPLRVDIIGPDVIRTGYPTAFDLVLQNPGNIDALTVPLWIAGIPDSATVALDFPLADPPQSGGEPIWSLLPDTLASAGGRYLAMIIPRVPPGTSVRRVYLTVPAPTTFPLTVALTPPWVNNTAFRNCMSAVITNTACMGSQLTALNDSLAGQPQVQAMNGIGVWAKIGWQCEGAASLAAALAEARQALGFMLQSVEQDSVPTGCGQSLSTTWREVLLVEAGGAVDPSDKFGNRGIGGTITSRDDLTYTIHFENLAGAMFPAQHAQVTDVLDADLDPATLRLGTVTFGKDPTGTPYHCYPQFDRTESKLLNPNLRVDVNVTLIGRTLTWYFNSVNPNGPLPPGAGFLPANNNSPEGEGSVLFTVRPRSGLPQHTEITNSATIRFDTNPPMTVPIPAWTNYVDDTPPASHVLTLGNPQMERSFTVSWAPEGDPADVLNYTVYYFEDGAFKDEWLTTPLTSAIFERRPGDLQPHTYAFYSRARDHVDNREDPPGPPGFDVQITSTTDVEIEGPPKLALAGARPNPAIGTARIAFTLPSRDPGVLEVIDLAGRRVLRRDVGGLGPGSHVVTLDSPRLRAGLYFIRLMHGGQVLRARMVLIR